MIKIEVKKEDLSILSRERYEYPHPRVMKRMEAIYLKGINFDNKQICRALDICNNTLLGYFRLYNEGGIEKLKELNFYRPKSELIMYSGSIETYFTENPPHTINEAAKRIKELTGLERHKTQIRKLLKSFGFKFNKIGSVPAKALTEEKKTNRETFWKKS